MFPQSVTLEFVNALWSAQIAAQNGLANLFPNARHITNTNSHHYIHVAAAPARGRRDPRGRQRGACRKSLAKGDPIEVRWRRRARPMPITPRKAVRSRHRASGPGPWGPSTRPTDDVRFGSFANCFFPDGCAQRRPLRDTHKQAQSAHCWSAAIGWSVGIRWSRCANRKGLRKQCRPSRLRLT